MSVGIERLAVHVPQYALRLTDLAAARGIPAVAARVTTSSHGGVMAISRTPSPAVSFSGGMPRAAASSVRRSACCGA